MGKNTEKNSKPRRGNGKIGKIVKTVISGILVIVMVVAIVAANTLLMDNNRMVDNVMGKNKKVLDQSDVNTEGLDLQYNKSDYTAE